ncbi:MAG: hypothetical protein ACRCX8_01850, partial [Sarcina sp.]
MNKNKIISLIGVATMTTAVVAPTATTVQVGKTTKSSNQKPSNDNAKNTSTQNNIPLGNSKIQIYNSSKTQSGTIKFDPNTMKLEVLGYNETTSTFLNISIYNPKEGKVIYTGNFTANNNNPIIYDSLNFDYGDEIIISHNSNQGNITVSNGSNDLSKNSKGTSYFEITKQGLIQNTMKTMQINPFNILGVNNYGGNLTGKANPNETVYANLNGQIYSAQTNSQGEFSIPIKSSKELTSSDKIKVYAEGFNLSTISPSIRAISNTITLNNVWNQYLGTISFNANTKKIEFKGGWSLTNPYLSSNAEAFGISLYNAEGILIKNVKVHGDEYPENVINDALNNTTFEYGDYIKIDYKTSSKINISNFQNQSEYAVTKPITLQITPTGLEESNIIPVSVNPIDILQGDNQKVVEGIITGKIDKANQEVEATINGQTFNAKSNEDGEYSIKVEDNAGFTKNTQIILNTDGYLTNEVSPVLSSNIEIGNSSIQIYNGWGTPAGKIKFNPFTNKFEVSQYNRYLGYSSNDFLNIKIYNENTGKIESSKDFNGNANTSALSQYLNNQNFQYGDVISISYDSSQGKVEVFNGKNNIIPNNSGSIAYFKIEKGGLQQIENTLSVNPIDILGNSNVTEATITGKAPKNSTVTVSVNGENFEGKSNADGNYSVNIKDEKGFTNSTEISISADAGEEVVTYPVGNPKLGLFNNYVRIYGNDGSIGQEITFNPSTMTINNSNTSRPMFTAQVRDGNTGEIVSSCSSVSKTLFTSKNNLNGTPIKIGDVISFYETQGMANQNGSLILHRSGQNTNVDATGKFVSYEITSNGLVAVANKNLKVNKAYYTKNNVVEISGKTLPNTNIKIQYGNKIQQVKSDAQGNFILNIPRTEIQIGEEVGIYVNSQNNEDAIVSYDPTQFQYVNSKIELINNQQIPVLNINMDPIKGTMNATLSPDYRAGLGQFYGNEMNMQLINSQNGKIESQVTNSEPNQLTSFINQVNKMQYNIGDIIKLSYNNNYINTEVFNGKNSIGNTNGTAEYFEITKSGLVDVTNKFIKVNSITQSETSGNKTTAIVSGIANKNEKVTVEVNGQIFKGMSDSNGVFSIPINTTKDFTDSTQVIIEANGFINTIVNPNLNGNVKLLNSRINIYGQGSETVASSIGFNVNTNKFNVYNYTNSFGKGNSNYFNLSMYNEYGNEIFNYQFNNGATKNVSDALNNQSFNYGDIIGFSYNPSIAKPVIKNGNTSYGNMNGQEQYFKITENGLVPVQFGNGAYTTNVTLTKNILNVSAILNDGMAQNLINGEKKLIVQCDNKTIETSSIKMNKNKNGNYEINGDINLSNLNLKVNQEYTVYMEDDGQIIPIKVQSNMPISNDYVINGENKGLLTITKGENESIIINQSADIGNTYKNISNEINSKLKNVANYSNLLDNSSLNNSIIVEQFINTIGVNALEKMYNESSNNARFIRWVLNNPTAMEEYLNGPNPEKIHQDTYGGIANTHGLTLLNATYVQTLQVWSNIWNTYSNSHYGFNQKLAIAVALSNGVPQPAWPMGKTTGNPVQRYNIFETLNANNGMEPEFKTLDVTQLFYVVSTQIPNDQIINLRNLVLENFNSYVINPSNLNSILWETPYNMASPYNGQSALNGGALYGPHPTLADIFYDGGVCAQESEVAATVQNVFGIPSQSTLEIATMAHAPFIYYVNGQWYLGYNVLGMANAEDGDVSQWSNEFGNNANAAEIAANNTIFTWLYEKANTPALRVSNNYLYLSQIVNSYQGKLNAINQAIKEQPLNVPAWVSLINLYTSNQNTSMSVYNQLSKEIISVFNEYPTVMMSLECLLQPTFQNAPVNDYNAYVNNVVTAIKNTKNGPYAQVIANKISSELVGMGFVDGGNLKDMPTMFKEIYAELENISNKSYMYTPASMNRINSILREANRMITSNGNLTIINSIFNESALKEVEGIPELRTNIVELQNLINEGNTKLKKSPNAKLKAVLDEANNVLMNNNDSESQVNNAISSLNTLLNNVAHKKVDTKGLTATITSGENVAKESGYTTTSIKLLDNAINSGKALLNNANVTSNQVQVAIDNINNAIKNLQVNKASLVNEINIAKEKLQNKAEYSQDTINALNTDLINANNINNNAKATVSEVSNAVKSLENSIQGLKANETGITQEINEAKAIENNASSYTDNSIKDLSSALANAEKIIENDNVTPQIVSQAQGSLETAIKRLQVNKTSLETQINKANEILKAPTGYTSASIKSLENITNEASKVLANPNATLAQVKTAETNLINGIKNIQINFSSLQNEINIGNTKLEKGIYSQATENTLKDAIANAQNIIQSKTSTLIQVKNAQNQLVNAINGLVDTNINNLKKDIVLGENQETQNMYTENTLNNLKVAIANAQKIAKLEYPATDSVLAAEKNILDSINNLEINFAPLENTIKGGQEKLNQGIYTKATEDVLSTAIANGKSVLKIKKPSLSTIEEAEINIDEAINNLVLIPEATLLAKEKSILSTDIINGNQTLENAVYNGLSNYTENSIASFNN